MLLYAIALAASYLLGAVSFSYWAGRLLRGIDIRQHGSGNAGATNTLRVLGKGPGIAVFLLDIFKGVAAVWIGWGVAPDKPIVAVLCGLLAIVGHNWPVYHGFKGGKGIATTIGVMATLSFLPTLFAGLIAVAVIAVTRYVSLGSLLFAGTLPVFVILAAHPREIFWLSILFAVFAVIRHRNNIVKLLQNKESKLGERSKPS